MQQVHQLPGSDTTVEHLSVLLVLCLIFGRKIYWLGPLVLVILSINDLRETVEQYNYVFAHSEQFVHYGHCTYDMVFQAGHIKLLHLQSRVSLEQQHDYVIQIKTGMRYQWPNDMSYPKNGMQCIFPKLGCLMYAVLKHSYQA